MFEDELIVGGEFTSIGGTAAAKIASWDGAQWRQIGSGLDEAVVAVHVNADILYIGGRFVDTLTGTTLNHIAQWDGAQWITLASGMPFEPYRFASYRDELMLARWYDRGGGWHEMGVSSWDGSEFREIGVVGNGRILDLTEFRDELYVTGTFWVTSGGPSLRVARWDGQRWRPVNGGVGRGWSGSHPQSFALAVYDDELIVGGDFREVEGQVSAHWDRWGCESCYADCDDSTGSGVLDIFDFLCFQNSFVSGDPYACDCDTATGPGVCDILDFVCFQSAFAAGCP